MPIYRYSFHPQSPLLNKSSIILKDCIRTLDSLLKIHDRISNFGQKQDLLRAILVFSTAGLDSLMKETIKNSLSDVIDKRQGSKVMFIDFVEREIRDNRKADVSLNTKLLARIFVNDNPQDEFKEMLVRDLTSNSLQSKDQVLKIASYFDIPSNILVTDAEILGTIFKERNKIIHEMDINFDNGQIRNTRTKDEVLNWAQKILLVGEIFVKEVDSRLINIGS